MVIISIRISFNPTIITIIQIVSMLLKTIAIHINKMMVDTLVKIKVITKSLLTIIKARKIIYQVIGPLQTVKFSMILV